MSFLQVYFSVAEGQSELLIATLMDMGFDSFQELDDELVGYIVSSQFNQKHIEKVLEENKLPLPIKIEKLPEQNWNAKWESGFQPISIGTTLRIRATFHKEDPSFNEEIIINPQMSFGTGHHDTTYQLLNRLTKTSLINKKVLDIGTGTGIFAIYAKQHGAGWVEGVDNDEWAFQNAQQNEKLNKINGVHWVHGTVSDTQSKEVDLIVANINKNVILAEFDQYVSKLKRKGEIWFSGFFSIDVEAIEEKASQFQLTKTFQTEQNKWATVGFLKS